jgi:hypothetical protein|tara:strand:- start:4384 stop:4671 length:288 start_codon:yes stop_codon:yes gene_type:complete
LIITPASQIGKNDLVLKADNHWARKELQKLQRLNLSSKVLLQKLHKQAHFGGEMSALRIDRNNSRINSSPIIICGNKIKVYSIAGRAIVSSLAWI